MKHSKKKSHLLIISAIILFCVALLIYFVGKDVFTQEINTVFTQSADMFDRTPPKGYISASDTDTPSKDVIDVSSHNGEITIYQYQTMKELYNIAGVVVKLTEGDSYINPFAKSQIENAQAVGMKVSVYHYALHNSNSESKKEAKFFAKVAADLNLPKSTIMVDDVESDGEVKLDHPKINTYTKTFLKTLHSLGYNNTSVYSMKNWFIKGYLKSDICETEHCWVAWYPKYLTSSTKYHSDFAMWQWSSKLYFKQPDMPSKPFDISVAYNDYFIK